MLSLKKKNAQKKKQHILSTLYRQLAGFKLGKLDKNRKAKVEATKNLKYLYSNSKYRQLNLMNFVKDDMIIYV